MGRVSRTSENVVVFPSKPVHTFHFFLIKKIMGSNQRNAFHQNFVVMFNFTPVGVAWKGALQVT